MIDQQQNNNVKLILRFFNLKNGIIHTTDKTEVEVEDEVNKYLLLKLNATYKYYSKILLHLLNNINFTSRKYLK